jgi:hypothetical protein
VVVGGGGGGGVSEAYNCVRDQRCQHHTKMHVLIQPNYEMNVFFSIINLTVCWHPCQIMIGSLTVTSRLVQRKPVLCHGGCFAIEHISALNL